MDRQTDKPTDGIGDNSIPRALTLYYIDRERRRGNNIENDNDKKNKNMKYEEYFRNSNLCHFIPQFEFASRTCNYARQPQNTLVGTRESCVRECVRL